MNETPVLEPESPFRPRSVGASPNRNINDIYWKKADFEADPGWIFVGPGIETAQAQRWQRKGRTPLLEYSYTDEVSPRTGRHETIDVSTGARDLTRYFWFFKNGGGPLFPVDQIIAYNWHVRPPFGLSPEVFPQLADWDLPEPLWCPQCPPTAPNKNSPSQVVQHAMISHGLKLPEAKALLEFARERPRSGNLTPWLQRKKTPEEKAEQEAWTEKMAAQVPDDFDPTTAKTLHCQACGEEIVGSLGSHTCPQSVSVAAPQATQEE